MENNKMTMATGPYWAMVALGALIIAFFAGVYGVTSAGLAEYFTRPDPDAVAAGLVGVWDVTPGLAFFVVMVLAGICGGREVWKRTVSEKRWRDIFQRSRVMETVWMGNSLLVFSTIAFVWVSRKILEGTHGPDSQQVAVGETIGMSILAMMLANLLAMGWEALKSQKI